MNKAWRLQWIVLLLACLGLMSAYPADTLHSIKAEGRTEISLTPSSGKAIHVTVLQTTIGNSFPYKNALLWGGDVDVMPKSVLSSIEIQEGQDPIFIPLSAYGDLGDVKTASVSSSTHGFTLILHGGSTATAYDAALSFEGGHLASRAVILREFPERREKASYSFPSRQ